MRRACPSARRRRKTNTSRHTSRARKSSVAAADDPVMRPSSESGWSPPEAMLPPTGVRLTLALLLPLDAVVAVVVSLAFGRVVSVCEEAVECDGAPVPEAIPEGDADAVILGLPCCDRELERLFVIVACDALSDDEAEPEVVPDGDGDDAEDGVALGVAVPLCIALEERVLPALVNWGNVVVSVGVCDGDKSCAPEPVGDAGRV